MRIHRLGILFCLLLLFCQTAKANSTDFTSTQFQRLLQTLADAWNKGDAVKASGCFTEDAIYTEPPDKQVYKGRKELFEFFGGYKGRAGQMSMTWHHIVFDPKTMVGAGEFTFRYGSTVHGVTMIRIRDGKISNWREYWYESPLEWDAFIGINQF